MQETSEWDCLTRGCAVLPEPRAQISSFVEGSVTVMLLSETQNFSPVLLTPALLRETFQFLLRGLTLVLYDLYFNHKSVFSASASAAHLTVMLSLIYTVVEELVDACFLSNNPLLHVKCCCSDTCEALRTCSPSLGLLSGASLVGALIQKGH